MRFSTLLITAAAAYGVYHRVYSRAHPHAQTQANMRAAAACEGKSQCITVYVAPWCPACKMSEPTFQMFHSYLGKNHPDIGFKIIIGGGKPAQNAEHQIALRPIAALTNDSGEIMQNLKVSAYPTWIVTDSSGNELFRNAGGLQLSKEEQVELFLKQYARR